MTTAVRIIILILLTMVGSQSWADSLDVGVCIAATADISTTEYALRTGMFREYNPIMQDTGVRIGSKVFATGAVLWVAKSLKDRGHPRWSKGLKIATIIVWGGAAAWNLNQIRRSNGRHFD
jgi:hypothetical protein